MLAGRPALLIHRRCHRARFVQNHYESGAPWWPTGPVAGAAASTAAGETPRDRRPREQAHPERYLHGSVAQRLALHQGSIWQRPGIRAAPRASSAWSMSGWPAMFMNCCWASASRSRSGWPLLFAGAPGRCPVPAGSPGGLAGVPAAAEGREACPAAHAAGDAQVRDGRRAGGLSAGAVRPGGLSQPHVPGRA